MDRLFVERLPGYRPGEVYRDLNRILREELGQVWPPIKKLSEEALEETDVVLNQIKRGLDGSNKSCTGSWLRSWLR